MTTTDTPRTDAYQYANYILNHYDPSSHKDKLCLAKSLIEHGYGAAKPKLTRESYDENWNMKQADTPRTDVCPHCGAEQKYPFAEEDVGIHFRKFSCGFMEDSGINFRPELCKEREARQKAEAEVKRLKVINADMRNFLAKAIHNEGFNEEQAIKFIYQ